MSFSQVSLALTILVSTVGTYIACSPPNPNPQGGPESESSPSHDLLSTLNLTKRHTNKFTIGPMCILAVHALLLAFYYPDLPPALLGHGDANGLNRDLITWSPATAIPLALILCVGIPLRLVSYASLGRNFTFALARPDRLTTTGIHAHLQHPSYTGVIVLVVCNLALLARADGVACCWFPPAWHAALRSPGAGEPTAVVLGLSLLAGVVWTRVRQEEQMLKAQFGAEWERWHAQTSRFIPGVF
ncbi:hypothetical protein PFICI_01237 [Pestalotiopsis fici W106-1]|uniref:Protein-S-isoprenylcysteine O-methyltransferase n=1 Tax=Pestalotiopsis fici (strain W106-1 / CGMCC3.15140) TaxID=1229662 RepID=W3XN45_PESFW|nr:uncharacterized protein PFICI_01237 [Pestalotiopsis fici W106-1]ETS87409.1 hypothetical protein PFICI_01237 [Pestalotiopsis fici W106-1]